MPSTEKLPKPSTENEVVSGDTKETSDSYLEDLLQSELAMLQTEQSLYEELLLLQEEEELLQVQLDAVVEKEQLEQEAERSMLNSTIPSGSAVAPSSLYENLCSAACLLNCRV